MRILWASNYTSQSAYAIQARMIVPRIQQAGHEVAVMELTNATTLTREIEGVTVLPVGIDPLGSDAIGEHFKRGRFHAVMSLVDAWGLTGDIWQQVNWFPLTPVDTLPAAPHVIEALKRAVHPIAISKFGQTQLKNAGYDALYFPHGYDPAVWRMMDKAQARDMMGIPHDAFFAAFVGVNDSLPSRKGIPELLIAWQMFYDKCPNSMLYMHTRASGNLHTGAHGGVNIAEIAKVLNLPSQSMKFVDQFRYTTGIPSSELAIIASAADVLVLPSMGEGFGVPIIEFGACGCPTITTDFAANGELAKELNGQVIQYEPQWNWQNAMCAKAGIADLADALLEAYEARHDIQRRIKTAELTRAYSINHVFPTYGIPVLNTVTEMTLARIAS